MGILAVFFINFFLKLVYYTFLFGTMDGNSRLWSPSSLSSARTAALEPSRRPPWQSPPVPAPGWPRHRTAAGRTDRQQCLTKRTATKRSRRAGFNEHCLHLYNPLTKMRRWSFYGVRELIGKCQPHLAFQQWNRGWSWHKKLKKSLIWISSMPGSRSWYLYHKNVKNWGSTACFRDWQVPTLVRSWYFSMHVLAERFVFGGDGRSFMKRVSRHIWRHQCRLLSRQLVFPSSHL